MHSFQPLLIADIDPLLLALNRKHLPYSEYSFLGDDELKKNYSETLKSRINDKNNKSFLLYEKDVITGFLSWTKNTFDTVFFGFPCYRLDDLIILSANKTEVSASCKALITFMELEILSDAQQAYISFGLSNNSPDMDVQFNSISAKGYYYIHTLVTFSASKSYFDADSYYADSNIRIRTAKKEDAAQVAKLASSSFKFSRFHLDPFLDNKKSDLLLRESAMNSILENYVDVMFIAEIDDAVVGYYSGKKSLNPGLGLTIGNAVISAVDSNFRGRGIFGKLDSHLLNWFADNTNFAEMGTYLANYPIHKTWINKGLGLIRSTHQFSKMLSA